MTDLLTIRPSGRDDLATIDALLSQSYPVLLKDAYAPSVLVTALPLISRAQPNLISSGTYFVVEDQDGIVGAGGWTWAAPQGGVSPIDMGHIRHVVTSHTRTRKGIGRALMARIFETARSAGVKFLDCQSTLTARPFYKACGFDEIGPIEIMLRPGIAFPAVRMQRQI